MGFWHTGYMEFHEPAGSEWTFRPTQVRYPCQHCQNIFDSMDDLRRHRFESHPYSRPLMFIRGVELGATPFLVTHRLISEDIQIDRVTSAQVNGNSVPLALLPDLLSKTLNDRMIIDLANAGVSARFEMVVRIAKDEHLNAIDAAFLKMAKTRSLTIRSIEGFIADCESFETASLYCDGLCHYLYGVLAKERAKDCTLSFDDYPERLTQAEGELLSFERSLAKTVRALVAFNFNHFEDSHNLAQPSQLQHAAVLFSGLLEGWPWHHGFEQKIETNNMLVALLTDLQTLRICRWTELGASDLSGCVEDIRSQLQKDIPEYDKFKMKILLAEALAYSGDSIDARRVARELMSNPRTLTWAEALMTRLPSSEKQE